MSLNSFKRNSQFIKCCPSIIISGYKLYSARLFKFKEKRKNMINTIFGKYNIYIYMPNNELYMKLKMIYKGKNIFQELLLFLFSASFISTCP